MNIIPGEPVPPGFEDEVNRVAEIQQAIDQYKGNALIGLEYTLEFHNEEDRRNPSYLCVLCDKRGDPRNIMQHWTSFNHRLKYLEKHYASAVREFKPVTYKPNSHALMVAIVQSLAEAIEDHHGRLTLSVCSAEDYRRMKTKILSEVLAKFHYDERNGPNFINIIDRTLWENNPVTPAATPTIPATAKKMDQTLQITIKAPKRVIESNSTPNRDLDEISSDSDGEGGGGGSKKAKKSEQPPAYRVLPRVRRSPPFEEERKSGEKENNSIKGAVAATNDPKKLPTPKELSLQASHIAQERYKWEKYRCMLEIQLKQMEKLQQDYEKNPEKHPLYPEEWKKFWNRRYKELQAEKKIDPNKYDYKPEWIIFWTKRMKDLFTVEVEKKKKEIKVKLGLPEDAEEKIDQLKEKYKVQVTKNTGVAVKAAVDRREKDASLARSSRGGLRERDKAPISAPVIDISDDDEIGGGGSPRYPRRRYSRSSSPPRPSRRGGEDYKRSRPRSSSRSPEHRTRGGGGSPMHGDYDRRRDDRYERERHRSTHAPSSSSRGYALADSEMDFYSSSTFSRSRYPPPPQYEPPMPTRYRVMDPYAYPKYERSPTPNSKSGASLKEVEPEPEEDTGPLTVVAVLRLLTALEDHLGSLGPKVVDLLGKALALEKFKANSADDMLLNDDHCVFFETIKEKLKGLLIADVLDEHQKVRAVKRAIKNIAAIIHQVTVKGKQSKENEEVEAQSSHGDFIRNSLKKQGNQGPSVKDLPFDRQVVSTKLAAALVMQGREDVSTDDMDKLIYMFVLMVKLSKAKYEVDQKLLYTKDILRDLGLPVPLSPAEQFAALPSIVDEILENEVSALVQEVEEEMSNDAAQEKEQKNNDAAAGSMLESLTDSDLQTLLQNFKHLSTEEQHHLIAHLKKLETADAGRVEKLRKFVNLGDLTEIASTSASAAGGAASTSSKAKQKAEAANSSSNNTRSRRYDDSPPPGSSSKDYSHYSDDDNNDDNEQDDNDANDQRRGGGGNSHMNVNPNKFSLDDEDEDDDYNFDEVFKAASSNVNRLSEDNSRQSTTKYDDPSSSSCNQAAPSKQNEPIVPVASSPSALTFNPAGLNISLSETQNLIANLMGSLQQSNANQNNSSNTKAPSAAKPSQPPPPPQPVPPIRAQQQQVPQANIPYYQQGQQQQQQQQIPQQQATAYSGYNQMGAMSNPQAYYNAMGATGGYNQAAANGYAGYQQPWGSGQQMQPNMQQFGMQGMQYGMTPQQQQHQQQQQQQQMGGYNMYGRGGN